MKEEVTNLFKFEFVHCVELYFTDMSCSDVRRSVAGGSVAIGQDGPRYKYKGFALILGKQKNHLRMC